MGCLRIACRPLCLAEHLHRGRNELGSLLAPTQVKPSPSSEWGSAEGGPGRTRSKGGAFLGQVHRVVDTWTATSLQPLAVLCFLLLIVVLALAFQGFQVLIL